VVGGGLALGLDEDGEVGGILAVPGLERLEELETVGGRETATLTGARSAGGAWYVFAPGSKLSAGRPAPVGSLSLNSLPSLSLRVSVSGLKFKVPASDMATTRSGEVTKE